MLNVMLHVVAIAGLLVAGGYLSTYLKKRFKV